jgi:trk system potassium uptake protein TrkA
MHIVIAGGGTLGRELVKRLLPTRHDLVVIDLDRSACETIYAKFGTTVLTGNATSLEVLEQARIDKCDAAIGVLKKDADNLAFALLAKHYGVKSILVSMIDPRYEPIYKSAGVTNIARATDLLIDQLVINLESPRLRKVITIGGELEICIISIPPEAPYSGTSLAGIREIRGFPRELAFPCLFEEAAQQFRIPLDDTVVRGGDRLFVSGRREDIVKAARILGD